MVKIWSKIISYWPQLLFIVIIVAVLLWPVKVITEKYYEKILLPNNNHLKTDKTIKTTPKKVDNTLIFGGDIMLSRTVNSKMEKYQNYNWPFESIAPLLRNVDLAIANLESPFLITDNYQVLTGSFSFKANPKSVSGLSLAGFDVLSLANNHILNQGTKGLSDTYQVLNSAGIDYVGPRDHNLVIKESKGIKFSFLSYTYDDSKLIASINDSSVKDEIALAKKQSDVVIVMMHAGTEYTRQPNTAQINFAHLAIDSGADLVVGQHPHWPQTIEVYKDKTIIYSLGNLIFDQMWSQETKQGLLAKVYFNDKELANIEYIPIIIQDYGQAQIMPDGAEKDLLLKSIGVQ